MAIAPDNQRLTVDVNQRLLNDAVALVSAKSQAEYGRPATIADTIRVALSELVANAKKTAKKG